MWIAPNDALEGPKGHVLMHSVFADVTIGHGDPKGNGKGIHLRVAAFLNLHRIRQQVIIGQRLPDNSASTAWDCKLEWQRLSLWIASSRIHVGDE